MCLFLKPTTLISSNIFENTRANVIYFDKNNNIKPVSFEELSQKFHLPLHVAAKEFGICESVLKKISRKCEVTRWP